MSKSYFDWELDFRKKGFSKKPMKIELENINSLGIPESEYKNFLKEWKRKNLRD